MAHYEYTFNMPSIRRFPEHMHFFISLLVQYKMPCYGPSGPSGPSGIDGVPGQRGPSGTSGIAGMAPSGPSGLPSNVSGPSGLSGMATIVGPSGALGPLGPSGPSGVYNSNDPLVLTSTLTVGGNVSVAQNLTVNGSIITNSSGLAFPGVVTRSIVQTFGPTELKAFDNAAPLTVVPAQGPNTLIWPLFYHITYIVNTTGYTAVLNDSLTLRFPGTIVTTGIIMGTITANANGVSGIASSTSSFAWEPAVSAGSGVFTNGVRYPNDIALNSLQYVNVPLVLSHTSAKWTNGNGSLNVHVIYNVYTGLP